MLDVNPTESVDKLLQLQDKLNNQRSIERQAVTEMFNLEISNAERLLKLKQDHAKKVHKTMMAYGVDATTQENQRLAAIELKEAGNDKKKRKEILAKYNLEEKEFNRLEALKAKIDKKYQGEQAKARTKAAKNALDELDKKYQKEHTLLAKTASATRTLFGNKKDQLAAIKEQNPEMSDGEAKAALAAAKLGAITDLAGDFLKEMESTMKDVASTKGLIDTQLQGSKNS